MELLVVFVLHAGLLASELRRYSNHRFFEFRRRTAYFANEQVREADQAIEHWQTLLRTLHVDQEHMSDLAENSLLHGLISLAAPSMVVCCPPLTVVPFHLQGASRRLVTT